MLSTLEYKLLIGLFGITLLVCSVRTSQWAMAEYNRSVESAEYEKKREALGHDKITFSLCNPCGPKAYEIIIRWQILILSLAFVFFIIRNPISILFSQFVLGIILYGYFDWARLTREIVLYSEPFELKSINFTTYYLYNSTYLDHLLFLLTSTLFLMSAAVLLRFVTPKVCARLGTNDQTLSP